VDRLIVLRRACEFRTWTNPPWGKCVVWFGIDGESWSWVAFSHFIFYVQLLSPIKITGKKTINIILAFFHYL
jgi:hypothetical protein